VSYEHIRFMACEGKYGVLQVRQGVMAYLERRPPRWKLSVNRDWPDWPS
jgi:hypothetical protein